MARKAAVAAAMELLDAGYTIRAAAKRLGVCEDALGKWLRNDRKRELEEAYRAGREAAARDLEAQADDEAQRPGRAEPSEIIERWLREAARIAREGNSERLAAELEDDEDPLSARCTTDDEPWSPEELP